MKVPRVLMSILIGIYLGLASDNHGKPRTGKHNAWKSAAYAAIVYAILIWGGFFS